MKKQYVKPSMVGERFVANEFCSSCGATGEKVYKFVCNAPDGVVYYKNNGNLHKLGGYEDCYDTHTVTVTSTDELPFYDGFVDRNGNEKEDSGEGAIIWVEWRRDIFGGLHARDWHASHAYSSITEIEVERS